MARKSRWRFWILAIVVIDVLCLLGFWADRPKNGIRVEELKTDLYRQISPRSTRADVENWFVSHGIAFGMMTDSAGREVGFCATVPNDSWADNAEIRIAIEFDDSGRITTISIYRFVYDL